MQSGIANRQRRQCITWPQGSKGLNFEDLNRGTCSCITTKMMELWLDELMWDRRGWCFRALLRSRSGIWISSKCSWKTLKGFKNRKFLGIALVTLGLITMFLKTMITYQKLIEEIREQQRQAGCRAPFYFLRRKEAKKVLDRYFSCFLWIHLPVFSYWQSIQNKTDNFTRMSLVLGKWIGPERKKKILMRKNCR